MRLGTILPLTVVKFPEKDNLDNASSLSLLSGYTRTNAHTHSLIPASWLPLQTKMKQKQRILVDQ